MLTKRQNMIMTIMNNQKDWIVGKDLAKLLNVSDRTIRNDIAAINEFYADTMIESNIRKGYRIQGEKVKRFTEETKKEIPETGEERRWLILKTLVEHNQVNIYQLADQMQIPAHLTTHSAKSRSVFPDITERVSASADQ